LEWSDFILPEFDYCRFPRGARVIDVGCGGGEQLRALRDAGFDAVGVEPSQVLVDKLVAEGLDARCGAAERLPVEDRSFDGLICKVVHP
jgi:SAM-dependent methyltransferase